MTEIKYLDVNKASLDNDIPTKIIKENVDIFSNFIFQSFNNMIDVCIFQKSLKLVNITHVLISILQNISKIYGSCLFKPTSNYFENIFSKFQRGFRQVLTGQYFLISMTEKWKTSVDKGKTFAALPTDICCPPYQSF